MKSQKLMLNTKRALAQTLKEEMKTKPFSRITVSDIAKKAGVNRNTFYYHFEDIYALLHWMFTEEAICVIRHFDLLTDYKDAIRFIMEYIDKNDYIISCLYDSVGREEMKRFLYEDLISIVTSLIEDAQQKFPQKLQEDFKDFLARFYTEAIAGTLLDWAKDRKNRDCEKTIAYFTAILENCLNNYRQFPAEVLAEPPAPET